MIFNVPVTQIQEKCLSCVFYFPSYILYDTIFSFVFNFKIVFYFYSERIFIHFETKKAALYFINVSDKIRSSINKLTLQINYQDIYVSAQYLNISRKSQMSAEGV